jgi:DNA polymerase-3 subunit delta'
MRFLREIIGHERIVTALTNAMVYERVAHAYLFAGPEGVGKETTALAFVRALMCSRPERGDACGKCRECRQVESRNHPDLNLLQPSGATIKIDQIRSVLRLVNYKSYQGGRKVYLVRRAEAMTAEAANCLLMTLEAPPENTVFILLSSRPWAMLPTVLSRCQQYHFKKIPVAGLVDHLVNRHGFNGKDARLYASLSGGSLGKALAWAAGTFQEDRNLGLELAEKLSGAGLAEAMETAEKISISRDKVFTVLDMLSCWYRDVLVFRETGTEVALFNRDRTEALAGSAQRYETGRLVEIIESIEATRNKIEANANTRLAVEALFLQLTGSDFGNN